MYICIGIGIYKILLNSTRMKLSLQERTMVLK